MTVVLAAPRSFSQFERIIDEILVPTFPAEELGDKGWLLDSFNDGLFHVCAAWDIEDGATPAPPTAPTPLPSTTVLPDTARPLGAAIASASHDAPGVMLLDWFAMTPASRGRGIGSTLFTYAMSTWQDAFNPQVIIGEVEDPKHHAATESGGDPVARIRFYRRHGAMPINVPFAMPRLAPDVETYDHMMLLALAGRALTDPSDRFGADLASFLNEYVRRSGEEKPYRAQIARMLYEAPNATITTWDD